MYPNEWHRAFGEKTGRSAELILKPLIQSFKPTSMIEIGCGNAHWSQVAIQAGIEDCCVVDGPWNNAENLLVDKKMFVAADLAKPLRLPKRFDLSVCLEVAEHIEPTSSEVLVQSLADASDIILFGAAIPYQGGHGHINEQWPSWWKSRFERIGYRAYDIVRPKHWSDRQIHYWYRQNILVYVNERNESAMATASLLEPAGSRLLIDAVHPEKFDEVASYKSLSLKRLVRRLPSWALLRVKSKLTGIG